MVWRSGSRRVSGLEKSANCNSPRSGSRGVHVAVDYAVLKSFTPDVRRWVKTPAPAGALSSRPPGDVQRHATIGKAAILGRIVGDRVFLAIALGGHWVGYAVLLQIALHRFGPRLRKLQVVCRRAGTVGVAAHLDGEVGVWFERGRGGVEHGIGLRRELRGVRREGHTLQPDIALRRRRRRRRRWGGGWWRGRGSRHFVHYFFDHRRSFVLVAEIHLKAHPVDDSRRVPHAEHRGAGKLRAILGLGPQLYTRRPLLTADAGQETHARLREPGVIGARVEAGRTGAVVELTAAGERVGLDHPALHEVFRKELLDDVDRIAGEPALGIGPLDVEVAAAEVRLQ